MAIALDANQAKAGEALLSERAEKQLRGGAAVGELLAGQFSEGQSLVASLEVKRGVCYSVVGIALPPVTRLELAFRSSQAPEFGALGDKRAQANPEVVLGDGESCLRWQSAEPGTAEVVLTVRGGQGVAMARVYERRLQNVP